MTAPDSIAIRVQHVSKQFRLGARLNKYPTLREALTSGVARVARRLTSNDSSDERRILHALEDISFDVRTGETLGIIGANGAGKSTLLKVLAQVVEPTAGRVELRGRLGSLLEVGTGFHQELTGRENIFLNGAILGMTRAKIRKKFDEIVALAEVSDFSIRRSTSLCGSRSPWRRISSPRSSWWTRCSPSAMPPSSRSAWGR